MNKCLNVFTGFSLLLSGAAGAAQTPARPNVIFFLTDDQGWTDSSLYGSTFYKTPAMERLARSGIRFTNAYSAAPLCSPTRASLMSGQYPARHGLTAAHGHMPVDANLPVYNKETLMTTPEMLYPNSLRFLELEQYTVAEAFRDAGYRTGFVGKWHQGNSLDYGPDKQGFEFIFRGSPDPGPGSYFSPYRFRLGNIKDGPAGEFLTERATEEALKYIFNGDKRPFFLCLWHWAVHIPFEAKEELIEFYRKNPDPRGIHLSPTMAAMIHSMDESLGRLLDELEKSGLDKNTIIVFTSDNGGLADRAVEADGGVMATSNYPLTKGKKALFEGGSRVPAIIRWPGVTDAGGVSDEIINSIDFYPTLLDICGIKPDPKQILDGVSLTPALRGGALPERSIYCFFPNNFTEYSPAGAWMRQGDWKLIEVFYVSDLWPEKYLLYNLKDDIGETRNLAAEYPERTAAMAAALKENYMTLCRNPPILNPDFSLATVPIGGWMMQGSGEFKLTDAGLNITSTGIRTRGIPRVSGAFKLVWKMRTARTGAGGLFWSDMENRQYVAERRQNFTIAAGGDWHSYSIEFESERALYGFRLDLGAGVAPAEIESIQLFDGKNQIIANWNFVK